MPRVLVSNVLICLYKDVCIYYMTLRQKVLDLISMNIFIVIKVIDSAKDFFLEDFTAHVATCTFPTILQVYAKVMESTTRLRTAMWCVTNMCPTFNAVLMAIRTSSTIPTPTKKCIIPPTSAVCQML